MHARSNQPEKISLSDLSSKLREAIASGRLEGIEPNESQLYDAYLLDQGKISREEHMRRAVKRAKS